MSEESMQKGLGGERPVLKMLLKAVGEPLRWRMLQELARGPKINVEFCECMGLSASAVAKHLNVLRVAGVVERSRARLYSIPERFRLNPGELDFGHLVVRVGK